MGPIQNQSSVAAAQEAAGSTIKEWINQRERSLVIASGEDKTGQW